jgi:hypothetical protein
MRKQSVSTKAIKICRKEKKQKRPLKEFVLKAKHSAAALANKQA